MNIDHMSYEELINLNKRVIDRLDLLVKCKIKKDMMKFSFGDYVYFESEDGETIKGHVKQVNQKTVTIISEDKLKWRVSPNFLKKVPTAVLSSPPS